MAKDLRHHVDGDVLVVGLTADDASAVDPDFDEDILRLLAETGSRRLIVDFQEVRVFQSLGISALIQVQRHCRQQGIEMIVCGLSSDVAGVFKITGLNRLVRVFSTESDARASFRPTQSGDPFDARP